MNERNSYMTQLWTKLVEVFDTDIFYGYFIMILLGVYLLLPIAKHKHVLLDHFISDDKLTISIVRELFDTITCSTPERKQSVTEH